MSQDQVKMREDINHVIFLLNTGDRNAAKEKYLQARRDHLGSALDAKAGDVVMAFLRVGREFAGTVEGMFVDHSQRPLTWAGHHSQGQEDRVLQEVFANQDKGFYIDVGANHPTDLSNTYHLYTRGWNGICLEPQTKFAKVYEALRPRDLLLPYAGGAEDGEALFHVSSNDHLSSLAPSDWTREAPVRVPVRRLDTLCREHDVPKDFDVLSIDVEGTELDVLRGLDLTTYRPRIIIAEYNSLMEINSDLQPFLIENGYHILYMTFFNIIATREFEVDMRALSEKKV